jgi:hypothetical protein
MVDGDQDKLPPMREKCGCGRPVRYINADRVGSCSKHGIRCATYNELSDRVGVLTQEKFNLLKIISELRSDLFYQISSHHSSEVAVKYPSIALAEPVLKELRELESVMGKFQQDIKSNG